MKHDEFNLIKGTVGSNKDLYFAFYVDNEISSKMPQKGEGYVLDKKKTTCTKGASVEFNENDWSVKVLNMTERNTKCTLYFESRYSESILNGTDPIVEEPLIPVIIENDGTVKKADVKSEWYRYEKKEWANAVILFDESESYENGEIIPEEKIESYFVWIPKYRYQLWDLGEYDSLTSIDTTKVHEIPIIFGDYTTLDEREGECTTPMESGATGKCQVGDYMTHPAFISIPSTGFWVGKFETGYNGATCTEEAEQNVNDSSKIIIKPNVYSWRGIQVANAFYSSYNYQRDLDSHMMKNTEWGAVAYLQHSAYGSAMSVRNNNNSDYITGYAANHEPTCGYTGTNEECNSFCSDGTCNTSYPNSLLASTTGNIRGIYDMSGGAWKLVMGVMLSKDGNLVSGVNASSNSGFKGEYTSGGENTVGLDYPNANYYDLYNYAASNSFAFDLRILGDATGEMGSFENVTYISEPRINSSWYNDMALYFLTNSSPWFMRGAARRDGNSTGIFGFGTIPGFGYGYRVVLTS